MQSVVSFEELPESRKKHFASLERIRSLGDFSYPEVHRYIDAGYIQTAQKADGTLLYEASRFYPDCGLAMPKLVSFREAIKLTGITRKMLNKYISLGRLPSFTASSGRVYVDIGSILASPTFSIGTSPTRNSRKVVFYAHEKTDRSDEKLRQVVEEYPQVTEYYDLSATQLRYFVQRLMHPSDVRMFTSTQQELQFLMDQVDKATAKKVMRATKAARTAKVEVECASN